MESPALGRDQRPSGIRDLRRTIPGTTERCLRGRLGVRGCAASIPDDGHIVDLPATVFALLGVERPAGISKVGPGLCARGAERGCAGSRGCSVWIRVRRHRARAAGAADVRRAGVPRPGRLRGDRPRARLPGQPPPRHHRPLAGRPHADARRVGPLLDRLQRRGLQLRRAARGSWRRCGHQFHSHTDTEVVLHAYVEWGERCVDPASSACSPSPSGTGERHGSSSPATATASSRSTTPAPAVTWRSPPRSRRWHWPWTSVDAGPPPPGRVVPLSERGRLRHRHAPRRRLPGAAGDGRGAGG